MTREAHRIVYIQWASAKRNRLLMTARIVQDVYWVFNPTTRQVEIVADGVILETTTLALAASRVTFHRNEAAKGTARIDSSPYKRQNRQVA